MHPDIPTHMRPGIVPRTLSHIPLLHMHPDIPPHMRPDNLAHMPPGTHPDNSTHKRPRMIAHMIAHMRSDMPIRTAPHIGARIQPDRCPRISPRTPSGTLTRTPPGIPPSRTPPGTPPGTRSRKRSDTPTHILSDRSPRNRSGRGGSRKPSRMLLFHMPFDTGRSRMWLGMRSRRSSGNPAHM
jgi:hypothetical protein